MFLKTPINNIPALVVQIMAWRRPGDKPLYDPTIISLLTHTRVTRPQWVKLVDPGLLGPRVLILKMSLPHEWSHRTFPIMPSYLSERIHSIKAQLLGVHDLTLSNRFVDVNLHAVIRFGDDILKMLIINIDYELYVLPFAVAKEIRIQILQWKSINSIYPSRFHSVRWEGQLTRIHYCDVI